MVMPEFIAEFTTNHMGNLNVLLRMVEEAAACGATYIKMQKIHATLRRKVMKTSKIIITSTQK